MSVTSQPAVTVYSTDTCPWCDRAKTYLKANNVPFVEKNVAQDYNAAVEMVRRSGQQGVPVITTDDDVILGFDQARLAKLVERYSAPRRLPLGLMAADAEAFLKKRAELAENYPEGVKGVYVGETKPNSVAAKAGLRSGDIIVAAAGKRVNDLRALDKLVDTLKTGESMSFRYYRGKDELTGTLQF
jgi:glutaredoxin-like YruB-family protein